jgi:uncharacterized membrane protein YjdF
MVAPPHGFSAWWGAAAYSREGMRERSSRSLLVGVPVGITFVGLAVVAHMSAGGRADAWRVAVASITAVAVAAVLARLRWTFTRLVLVALVSQPLLHIVLAHGSHADQMMEHGGHHHEMVMGASSSASHTSMPLAHSALAVVSAVAVRWGLRWLRSMPDVARALVVAGRGAVSAVAIAIDRVTAYVSVACTSLAGLLTWDTRGPP